MLKKILVLNYTMTLVTGLHIGGSTDTFDIGGVDSSVIKNPLTKEPYIPGSSIKGKVRSLLLKKHRDTKQRHELVFENDTIRNLFEPVEENNPGIIADTRTLFRDAVLTQESKQKLEAYLGDGVFTEIKAENKINPLSSKPGNPRFIERVPAGAEFEGQIVLQIYEDDPEARLMEYLQEGLNLLELNYLGASGSRGYGRVKLNTIQFEEASL
ncbi:type III-A CRISPR-associated RAMP protein Csm3 [uncultured Dubosiella sp.]|uniref:type III-A CRISPR-associated RAMP protein Csm3 n=1 Tax=uncultured Dubosiella sp. TaxID=1937011 RepID=UPI00272EFFED|nr:type III-A CRISPR-associated RAMP protein Csm3 [uncultured Dubosiella sp.]